MAILFAALVCMALPASAEPTANGRPKIGLVLGGGGARGAAHVGILRVLEEMHVPVDYVAGTSMGAVIGGLYAAGLTPDEIEHEIKTLPWGDMFTDESPRDMREYHDKQQDRTYIGTFAPGFSDGELKLPLAYLQGQKLDLALNRLTMRAAGIQNFDKLTIPFRAVASNIATGEKVVLSSGKLAQAIRASMAVPGIFAPVRINGDLLVDGGIADNLPIDVAREMGADIIIAVNVGSQLKPTDQIKSALDIVSQLTDILVQRNSMAQIRTLSDQDILIVPPLGDFSSAAFSSGAEAIDIGLKAANDAKPRFKKLAVSESAWERYRLAHAAPKNGAPIVDFIRIDNQSRIGNDAISALVKVQPGQPLNVAELDQDVSRIYGLGIFETVQYELVEEDGKTGLVIQAKQRSWGPDYVQMGVSISDNFKGDNRFNFALSYWMTELNELNGQARANVQLGQEPKVDVEWYQPLDPLNRYFASASAGWSRLEYYLYSPDYTLTSNYQLSGGMFSLAAGRNFGTWGELRGGLRWGTGSASLVIGQPTDQDLSFTTGEAFLRFGVDTMDNVDFPHNGIHSIVELSNASPGLGSDTNYTQLAADYTQAWSKGKNTWFLGGEFGLTANDNAPIQSLYRTGGFLRLSGFQNNQLSGQDYALARLGYYRQIDTLAGMPLYLGGSLEYGGVWQKRSDISLDTAVWAGSVYTGLDTPIGPTYLAWGMAQGGHSSLYLFVGRPF